MSEKIIEEKFAITFLKIFILDKRKEYCYPSDNYENNFNNYENIKS